MGEGRNLVGVDIGTASIKVCQVKETRKGLGLVRLGYAPLGPQVIVDGQVMDSGAVVETLQKVFHNAKLKPMVCDIDAFTVQNLFEYSRTLPHDQTIALINVGASLSSLNIIANSVSAFTREIANGGNVITEEIQKQLGVPHEQAEAYKCGGAANPEDPTRPGMVPQQVVQVIEAVTDSIAAEIQRSLDFFMATSGDQEISKIYVTGGSANLPSLASSIERRARVSVETWS